MRAFHCPRCEIGILHFIVTRSRYSNFFFYLWSCIFCSVAGFFESRDMLRADVLLFDIQVAVLQPFEGLSVQVTCERNVSLAIID